MWTWYVWNRKEYKTRVPSRVSVRMVFSEGIQTEAIQESKIRIINAGKFKSNPETKDGLVCIRSKKVAGGSRNKTVGQRRERK